MSQSIITKVRKELKDNVDSKTLSTGQNFFKEEIKLYGVKVSTVSKLSKRYYADIEGLEKEKIFGLCEKLWKSGYIEESFVACNWSYYIKERYEFEDFKLFERWINDYINNWASCDTLCNHSVGAIIEQYPKVLDELKKWGKSDNRWFRRASAVSLIIPARKGKFLREIFEIADILLLDNDDLVRKGYGWMLKAASGNNQHEVLQYVLRNKTIMPRTSLRYAIEKMPKELRELAMEK